MENITAHSLPSNSTAFLLPLTLRKLSTTPTYFDLSGFWATIYESLPESTHPHSSVDAPRVIHFPLLIHLLCVIPAFFLAFPLYSMKQGTRTHKILGRIFMGLMLVGVSVTYNIKLLRRNDSHRDFICHLSPPFLPDLFCQFSVFHLGTTITMTHIVLSLMSIKRRDFEAHKRWTYWVAAAVIIGGPLLPRERLTAMWLRGEMPAWRAID